MEHAATPYQIVLVLSILKICVFIFVMCLHSLLTAKMFAKMKITPGVSITL